MKHLIMLFSLLALAGLNAQESSDTETVPSTPAPPNCDGEKHHQFDFWIGEWTVYSGENVAGHNTIATLYDGCVLTEHWKGWVILGWVRESAVKEMDKSNWKKDYQ